MIVAVLVSASLFVAGIGAYDLIKGQAQASARRTVSIGLGVAGILLPVQVFVGDQVAAHEFPAQPAEAEAAEAEAAEGNWSTPNTGWVLVAIPDQQAQRNIAQFSIPCLGSAFYGDLSRKTRSGRTMPS